MKRIVQLIAIVAGMAMASPASAEYVFRDGKFVWVGPAKAGTASSGALPATPLPSWEQRLSAMSSVRDGASIIKTMFSWRVESERKDAARKEAERQATQLARAHPGETVVVAIFGDKPPQLLMSDDAKQHSRIPPAVQVNEYTVATGQRYRNRSEAIRDLLGPLVPEYRQGGSAAADNQGHLRDVVVAVADAKGGVQIGPVTAEDKAAHRKQEEERLAEIDRQRKAAADLALQAARQKEQEAQRLDNAARKRAEDDRKAAEQRVADENARAEARKKSYEAIKDVETRRDTACKSGSGSDCIKAQNEASELFEKARRAHHTAYCMNPDVRDPPKGGPCAEDAPPCMNCNRMQSLATQTLLDRQIGTRLFVADRLSARGLLSERNFHQGLSNLRNGRDIELELGRLVPPGK